MPNPIIEAAEYSLRSKACFETSWEALGLPYDQALADEVVRTAPEEIARRLVEAGVAREGRAISPACQLAAKNFMRPLVDCLFVGQEFEHARRDWFLFGVNYYETGDVFPVHRDLYNSDLVTIVIASISGVRKFRVESTRAMTLRPQSIMLLDGGANPEHSASCIEGPSISVVADVPSLLYPAGPR